MEDAGGHGKGATRIRSLLRPKTQKGNAENKLELKVEDPITEDRDRGPSLRFSALGSQNYAQQRL